MQKKFVLIDLIRRRSAGVIATTTNRSTSMLLLSLCFFGGFLSVSTAAAVPLLHEELVADIRVGDASSYPFDGVPDGNGRVFCIADDGIHGNELWIYEQEEEGGHVRMVKDIRKGPKGADLFRVGAGVMQGIFYFRANDGVHGSELWRSDGTEDGTFMIKDIYEGEGGSYPFLKAKIFRDKYLFFGARTEDTGFEPWVSDGTEDGTFMLKDVHPGHSSSNPAFYNIDNITMIFSAEATGSIDELWTTDGTPAETKHFTSLVSTHANDIFDRQPPQALDIYGLISLGNKYVLGAYIDAVTTIWTTAISDGQGTEMIYSGPNIWQFIPYTINGKALFLVDDDIYGEELWTTDGTVEGTSRVADLLFSSGYSLAWPFVGPMIDNERLILFGGTSEPGRLNYTLIVSDLTEGGTKILLNLALEAGEAVRSTDWSLLNDGRFMFSVVGETQGSIWITDGTIDGTEKMVAMDWTENSARNTIGGIIEIDANGTIVFSGASPETGVELYQIKIDPLPLPTINLDLAVAARLPASPTTSNAYAHQDVYATICWHVATLLLAIVLIA